MVNFIIQILLNTYQNNVNLHARLHHGVIPNYVLVVQLTLGNEKRVPAPEVLQAQAVILVRKRHESTTGSKTNCE